MGEKSGAKETGREMHSPHQDIPLLRIAIWHEL